MQHAATVEFMNLTDNLDCTTCLVGCFAFDNKKVPSDDEPLKTMVT